MERRIIGIIGGTGLYEMEGLREVAEVEVETPFGKPSDLYVRGNLEGTELIFLPRHGRGHRLLPSEINFRANIFGMKKLGVEWLISVGAVGSLREEIRPGHVVTPDQFIDRTHRRLSTFFGQGIVAHVSLADPTCSALRRAVLESARKEGAEVHAKGTYLCMEGPQFSTRAESHLYRSWGADVIGMTNLQEAKLSREAEICFASMALATDYDCWNETEGDVEIEQVLIILQQNVRLAQRIIHGVVGRLPDQRRCPCACSLKNAIVTERSRIPFELRENLRPLIGKYL